jgi:hypothetical protein
MRAQDVPNRSRGRGARMTDSRNAVRRLDTLERELSF